ncbi:PDF receptor isoform X2 [Culicoides brevitarsis]|uniref:PDF receptor isoform X1 n=1 Tax=Culicoides brevitarsis TaxID=469753 RepID=UPI00307B236B
MMTSTLSATDVTLSMNLTADTCASLYQDYTSAVAFCSWTWDKVLCWPPTPAGTIVKQRCPSKPGIDSSKFAERRCSAEGKWEGKSGENQPNGWTNYTSCFTPEARKLLDQVGHMNEKIDIAERTRILEMVGFSISLAALLLSLVIFCQFRTLRNNRTKIHKNLFIAMIVQVIIRLTKYIDQAILRNTNDLMGTDPHRNGISNTPILCESSIVLLEYAKTAMFMWMFIEGLYLHNVVTVTVFQGRFPHKMYILLGWGGPILMTTVWTVATAKYMETRQCWDLYNLTPYYWILEGPRLAIIILNLVFLLNIIRVLVVKLRQSHTSDVEQVRKAVRAAIVLLPLLGITNALNMINVVDRTPLEFAIWSYTTHFLTSFQGFLISLLYCFLNGEVRAALLKSLSVYMSIRGHHDWVRRPSMFSAAYNNTAADTEAANYAEVLDRSNCKQMTTTNNNFNRARTTTTALMPEPILMTNNQCKNTTGDSVAMKSSWILCFRGPEDRLDLDHVVPESVVFDLSE